MTASNEKSTETKPDKPPDEKDSKPKGTAESTNVDGSISNTDGASTGSESSGSASSGSAGSGSAGSTDKGSAATRSYVKNVSEIKWFKVSLFFLLVTLLFMAVRYEFFSPSSRRPEELLDKTKAQFESKQYTEALKTADNGISLFPYEPYFHFYKSQILKLKGFNRKALDEIMLASRTSDDYPIMLFRAQLLADCGNFQTAVSDFERLSRNPEWAKKPEVIEGKIRVEMKMGATDKALADIDRAIKLDPNVAHYTARAKLQTKLSHYQSALADWTKIISLSPQNSIAFAERALIEFKTNQLERANSDIATSLKISPSSTAYYNRGVMNAAQKKVKAASSDFLEALKLDPANLPAIEALGEIYGEHDQYKAALSRFDDSLKSVGAKDSPYYYQGRAALESSAGRYKEAIADLTKAAQGGSDPEAVRSSIAQCYFRMGDLPAAYRLYSHLIEDNPQQYELYLKRGNVASKQRRFSLAAADFANAVGLMPDAFEGYMLEGQAHADAKASGLALVCFRHALRLKPNNEEARRKVAECTREKEAERLTAVRPDKDTLAYESMLRLIAASDPSHLKQLSYQALEGGDVDFAVLALTRAIKLKPDDPVLRQYMTSALLTQGKYSQAIDQFLARAQISKLDLTEKLLFAKQIPERDVVSKFYGALIEQYRKDPLALYNIALDCDSQSLVPPAEAAVAAGLKVATDSDRARLLSMQAQLKDKQRQEYEKFSPEDLAKLKSYVQPNRN